MSLVTKFGAVSSTVSVLTVTANDTLTTQEAVDVGLIKVTSSGTAVTTVTFPTDNVDDLAGKIVYVDNQNTSGATLVIVSGETGITVAADKSAILYCDGEDFVRLTADA